MRHRNRSSCGSRLAPADSLGVSLLAGGLAADGHASGVVVFVAAAMMTYLELSADNTFYDNFTSALFLPHTAIDRFPTVRALLEDRQDQAEK